MEDTKELLNEVKKGVVEDLKKEVGTIVADYTKELDKKFKELKAPSKDEAKAQEAKKALNQFQNLYQKQIYKKDLDTETAASGEELVPEYYSSEVVRIASQYGVARNNARVINMPAKTMYMPTMGSATAYRTDEGSAYTASSPTTGQISMTAKKLTGMVIVTKELIEDANVNVLNYLASLCGEAISQKEDQWAFLGLEAGEGIFRNSDIPVYTLGSGDTTYNSVTIDDVGNAMKLLDDAVVKNSRILSSWDIAHGLRMEKDDNGQYILPQSPASGSDINIFGLPMINSTVLPKSTDSGSQADSAFMAIYDPRYLMIADRMKYELEFSKEATVTSSDGATSINLWEQDMVAIKVSERLDIKVTEAEKAFTIIKTSAS